MARHQLIDACLARLAHRLPADTVDTDGRAVVRRQASLGEDSPVHRCVPVLNPHGGQRRTERDEQCARTRTSPSSGPRVHTPRL